MNSVNAHFDDEEHGYLSALKKRGGFQSWSRAFYAFGQAWDRENAPVLRGEQDTETEDKP